MAIKYARVIDLIRKEYSSLEDTNQKLKKILKNIITSLIREYSRNMRPEIISKSANELIEGIKIQTRKGTTRIPQNHSQMINRNKKILESNKYSKLNRANRSLNLDHIIEVEDLVQEILINKDLNIEKFMKSEIKLGLITQYEHNSLKIKTGNKIEELYKNIPYIKINWEQLLI